MKKLFLHIEAALYLLVEGHIERNKDFLLVLINEFGSYGGRFKQEVTNLLLNQLLCKKGILSDAHKLVTRHRKAIFILKCLGPVEG